ncbi:MAG: Hint domain-containing protein [Paracoccaceae bacterium]
MRDPAVAGGNGLRFVYSDERLGRGRIEALDPEGRGGAPEDMGDVLAAIPCFTPETRVLTERGLVAVDGLSAGDRVVTRDHGSRRVVWSGRRAFGWRELGLNPLLRPVRIRAGALGEGLPERDILLSPNHRILFAARTATGGHDEAFVPARDLAGRHGVEIVAPAAVTYVQLLFDRHEAVLSEGIWSESFLPDPRAVASLGERARDAIRGVFGSGAGPSGLTPARPMADAERIAALAI